MYLNRISSQSIRLFFMLLVAALVLGTHLSPNSDVQALECSEFTFPHCSGTDRQYGGNFDPGVGYGGFGGGECVPIRTPVVFIHGNADKAINWDCPITGSVGDFPASTRSVYRELKAQGYNDCELFGITYLSESERRFPQLNYHSPDKYQIIIAFIDAVKFYTGKSQVDIVAHSLGVSMAIAALTYYDTKGRIAWGSVRKFVNIAGGIRGLNSCLYVGPANFFVSTCGSEYRYNPYIFGFYPDNILTFPNSWTGDDGPFSMRREPLMQTNADFYTIHAGEHDEIHCATLRGNSDCTKGALFVKNANVKAQLNVGTGSTAWKLDLDFEDWSPFVVRGGDADGIGHFKAKINTGKIIYEMLNSDCTGSDCRGTYTGGPVMVDDGEP